MDLIETQYRSFKEILSKLDEDSDNIELALTIRSELQKHFLLCVASHFESEICKRIKSYSSEMVGTTSYLHEFVKRAANNRNYNLWFDWKANNVNKFFGMFGSAFKECMGKRVSEDANLGEAIRAFRELGAERNKLIHDDLAASSYDKTLDEVYKKYKSALLFVELFPEVLLEREAS